MNDIQDLIGPTFGPAAGGAPKQIVILCHGLGADGNDLIGLAPYYARKLPNAVFHSPNAPLPCDMAAYGYQWFSFQTRTSEDMAGVRAARSILDRFIDRQLEKYNLPPEKLALVGFSQGTMISLFTAPRRAKAIGGVVGYSGRLIGAEVFAAEAKSKPPILLINGDADELVPVANQPHAVEALEAVGIQVEAHIRKGLPHSIDQEGIEQGTDFLARVLGA